MATCDQLNHACPGHCWQMRLQVKYKFSHKSHKRLERYNEIELPISQVVNYGFKCPQMFGKLGNSDIKSCHNCDLLVLFQVLARCHKLPASPEVWVWLTQLSWAGVDSRRLTSRLHVMWAQTLPPHNSFPVLGCECRTISNMHKVDSSRRWH